MLVHTGVGAGAAAQAQAAKHTRAFGSTPNLMPELLRVWRMSGGQGNPPAMHYCSDGDKFVHRRRRACGQCGKLEKFSKRRFSTGAALSTGQKNLDLIIDAIYYQSVGAAAVAKKPESDGALSEEMIAFVDHLAELLAAEFVRAMKEDDDAGGGVREVLEREPAGAEHRGPDPGLQGIRGA
jgi:hypothetical protein